MCKIKGCVERITFLSLISHSCRGGQKMKSIVASPEIRLISKIHLANLRDVNLAALHFVVVMVNQGCESIPFSM